MKMIPKKNNQDSMASVCGRDFRGENFLDSICTATTKDTPFPLAFEEFYLPTPLRAGVTHKDIMRYLSLEKTHRDHWKKTGKKREDLFSWSGLSTFSRKTDFFGLYHNIRKNKNNRNRFLVDESYC